ncbi:protein CPR-5 isoform X2 [Primulina tabacum]|uniref:protein CPR-5 isoform X2 n=1 Tax=Primulina tabacum TaxID=48773 RepID=UPI003F59B142
MDAPLVRRHHPKAVAEIQGGAGESTAINGSTISCRKTKKKKKLASDSVSSASSASSNNCVSATLSSKNGFKIFRNAKRIRVGSTTTRERVGPRDVDALGLPLGMSIAAVVAQVLERKNASGEKISDDYLSGLCILAVRESLSNVFGNKFDSFVTNFEKSFRSTLMTLRLIKESSQNAEETRQKARFRESSCSAARTPLSLDGKEDSTRSSDNNDGFESFSIRTRIEGSYLTSEQMEDNTQMDLMNRQLVNSLHDEQIKQLLPGAYTITSPSNPSINKFSMLSTVEKSVMEQTRSNDLKTFEIGLIMKKLQLKERQLSLNSDSNFLERWKLSMGFSKASFKAEKFKTQLRDTRETELLRKCLDFLVSGLIIMLFALAYGTYVYSHRRITEITESCSPPKESKSWWMPTSMSTFTSGLQIFRCQIQVLSRMLFGIILIGAITFLLIQRSSTTHQTMPITFIVLLLGVGCGYAGKFCIDTLGGSGNHWLIYWEAICLLHFFSNVFHSTLFVALNGPVTAVESLEEKTMLPYWARRLIFYSVLLSLPLLCGLMPFASFWEWIDHFSSLAVAFNDEFH